MSDKDRFVDDQGRVIEERERRVVRDDAYLDDSQYEEDHYIEEERRLRQLRLTRRAIFFIANVIAILIVLRFTLKALGADPNNPFAQLLYAITAPLVGPFLTLFGQPPQVNLNIFEFSSLFAIAIYYLLAWLIIRLVTFFSTLPSQ